ncbi:MAG: hypothetical protein KGM44_11085, partial [bacterium]|nr:hypothetical protein [bacterium]
MEHAVFADLSDLQLLVTRFVYEDRAALPLSWRQALGFRHLLHAARAGLGRRPPASRHQRHARLAAPAPCERRSAASCGAALRDRQSAILGA